MALWFCAGVNPQRLMTARGPGLMSFSGTLSSIAVRWLSHYQLPVQSRWTHRGVLAGRALTRPWDGMAVGLGAQARALPLTLPRNVVGFLGNGHRLPLQTPFFTSVSMCVASPLSRPLVPPVLHLSITPLEPCGFCHNGTGLHEEGPVLGASVLGPRQGLAAQDSS